MYLGREGRKLEKKLGKSAVVLRRVSPGHAHADCHLLCVLVYIATLDREIWAWMTFKVTPKWLLTAHPEPPISFSPLCHSNYTGNFVDDGILDGPASISEQCKQKYWVSPLSQYQPKNGWFESNDQRDSCLRKRKEYKNVREITKLPNISWRSVVTACIFMMTAECAMSLDGSTIIPIGR